MEIIGCPECDASATVVSHTPPGSRQRGWGHVFVTCVRGHWFLMSADMLPGRSCPSAPA